MENTNMNPNIRTTTLAVDNIVLVITHFGFVAIGKVLFVDGNTVAVEHSGIIHTYTDGGAAHIIGVLPAIMPADKGFALIDMLAEYGAFPGLEKQEVV